ASTMGESESDGASGGVDLPPGCGDGVVDPEQFCFEPVLVPGLAQASFVAGIDLDDDGRDEIVVGYNATRAGDYPCDRPQGGYCLSVFSFEAGTIVHRQ